MPRRDGGGWPAYVPVAKRRRIAEREAARLRKKGRSLAPIRIESRAIATTVWGKAWCGNLESYRDYESRLPRGRTYVRNGSIIDLQVAPGEVKALVSGSSVYQVAVTVAPVPAAQWRSLRADCAGRVESLVELLQGRLSKGVMERMCRQGAGLFPKPSEIRFSCTCEDHASMCKHVAAVLYGVGARLDEDPALLFRLRAVEAGDLLADLGNAMPASRPAGGRVLAAGNVSALFGLDLAEPDGRSGGGQNGARPSRPSRGTPAAAKPVRPAPAAGSGATPATPAATAGDAMIPSKKAGGMGRKAAEEMVAKAIARIGKHLTMGVDVAAASPGKAVAGVRKSEASRDVATGSGAQAPSGRPVRMVGWCGSQKRQRSSASAMNSRVSKKRGSRARVCHMARSGKASGRLPVTACTPRSKSASTPSRSR